MGAVEPVLGKPHHSTGPLPRRRPRLQRRNAVVKGCRKRSGQGGCIARVRRGQRVWCRTAAAAASHAPCTSSSAAVACARLASAPAWTATHGGVSLATAHVPRTERGTPTLRRRASVSLVRFSLASFSALAAASSPSGAMRPSVDATAAASTLSTTLSAQRTISPRFSARSCDRVARRGQRYVSRDGGRGTHAPWASPSGAALPA